MKTIYLLRHGEIPSHTPRRFIGQTEVALTDRGRAQIARVADFLRDARIAHLVTSPLTRCRESAEILARHLGLAPEIEPALREIALGRWEGLTIAEVEQLYPGSYEARGRDLANYRPAEGENFTDLGDRVWPRFVDIINEQAGNIAFMGHAGVNRVLLCHILGMPLSHLFRLRQDHACINSIRWQKSAFELTLLNYAPESGAALFIPR